MNSTARSSLFWLALALPLLAQNGTHDTNQTLTNDAPVVIEDTSGLSEKEIRKKAHEADKTKPNLKIKEVVESIDENTTVNVTKPIEKKTAFSPTPKNGFDWIQTKYGDWLVGHIRSLYDDELEFDSKEFGIYTFKLKDLTQIKSYSLMEVNIDNVAIIKGIVRYKEGTITIIGGDHTYTFDKKLIISITPPGDHERNKWTGDISFNIDIRQGNIKQQDFSLKTALQRRTPKNRFLLDYLGRYTTVNGERSAQDNRLNLKYDIFYAKKFFFTPAQAELYENYFQNIKFQSTLGMGLGYTLFDTSAISWDISIGPAYLHTRYYQRTDGKNTQNSLSFEASSKYKYKINPLNTLKTSYRFTLMKKEAGRFKHHLDITLESDIVKERIFVDTSFLWDYLQNPQPTDNYMPLKNDYQLLLGGGVKF